MQRKNASWKIYKSNSASKGLLYSLPFLVLLLHTKNLLSVSFAGRSNVFSS